MTSREKPLCVVTGGTGYIGRRLIGRLAQGGDVDVAVLCRRGPERPEPGVVYAATDEWSAAGLSKSLDDAFDGAISGRSVETVFHLAGYGVRPGERDVEEMIRVNAALPATMTAFAALRGARLLTAGSNAEYADPRPTANDEAATLSETAELQSTRLYGSSKAAGWLAAAASARALGVIHLHLRIFNVYGPFEHEHRLTSTIVRAHLAGEKAPLSDGAQVRDFIHVDDVVEAFLSAAATIPRDLSEAINICTGRGVSVRCFAESMARALNARPEELLNFGAITRRPDDIDRLVGAPSKAADLIGWRARLSINEGVRRTTAEIDRTQAVQEASR